MKNFISSQQGIFNPEQNHLPLNHLSGQSPSDVNAMGFNQGIKIKDAYMNNNNNGPIGKLGRTPSDQADQLIMSPNLVA